MTERPALMAKKATWRARFERAWLAPVVCLFVVTAEFSRYLSFSRLGALVFAPRNFFILGILTLGAWAGLALIKKDERSNVGRWRLLITPVVLLGWIGSAWSISSYPTATPITLEWLNGTLLLLLIGIGASAGTARRRIATALVVSVALIVGIGLIEKITDTHLPLSNLHNPYRQQWAVTSVFIGQNHLAASLGLLLPLVAGFGLIWPGWRRWLAGATVIAGLVVLFFTGSSLTLIAVLVASLVFAGAGLAVVRADARKRLVAGLVVLASLVIAGWFVLPATVQDRVRLGTIGITQSFEARIALARQGIELALEHPLSGHGPGATEEIVHVTLEGQPTLRALHNVTLEFAVTYGVAAAALVGVWLLWLVTQLVRQLRRSGARQQWSIIAVLASLAALLIVQSVPSTFEGVRAPFIVVGFALALAMQRSRSKYVASQVVSS